ncbi:MAG: DivIVA domain-containing protein, partial [Aquihabitans sp.]
MELTLKRLLEQAKFTTTRKGYDQDEVDDFLDRAVAMATKVEAKLTETLAKPKAATGDAASPAAPAMGPGTPDFEAEVERRVQSRLAEAPALAARPVADHEEAAAEAVSRTLVLAQRTADAAVSEAKAEAEAILAGANEHSQALTAEANEAARIRRETAEKETEAARAEAHERLSREISSLELARDGLRGDVSLLESHVEEQRSQLRSTVAELQRLLDDPAVFRLAPSPALHDPQIPEFAPAEAEPEPASIAEPEAVAPGEAEAEAETEAETEADAGPTLSFPAPDPAEPAVETPADPPAGTDAVAPTGVTIEDLDHETPGIDEPDSGPPTALVSAI